MRPTAHLISGIVMGGAVLAATERIDAAVLCGIANVVSDTDHLIEYGVYCLKYTKKPDFQEFMSGKYFSVKGTLGIVFHGYEYLLGMGLIWILLWQHGSPNAINSLSFTMGYGIHLLMDLIGNDCSFKGYSFIYRLLAGFDEKKICGKQQGENE